ncbi:predicted protein [Streptomyces iranensis]|uniref:Uncharacterized protein n=1 Tax=Streptomyces iranensis TaxID=576784 RepID=A0A060ZEP1_9ACTN|nr:hypothetical protein [Streptomyces iranensis]CDR04068.1 predicted protein [Streptomyces iranensis]
MAEADVAVGGRRSTLMILFQNPDPEVSHFETLAAYTVVML